MEGVVDAGKRQPWASHNERRGRGTLLSIRTSADLCNSLFVHTEVNNCSESSIRLVRGSSSRYCHRWHVRRCVR